MFLKSIKVEQLRNITLADINFRSNINIITGNNGAGKTTLLEAIYLLGRARSFRSGQQKTPIQKGKECLTIFSTLKDENSKTIRIGLSKSATETRVKIDGTPAKKLSILASTLPIALITPQSHRILDEGPEHRRRLLNWGVFHVEQSFKSVISDYSRSLLQRNNVLRVGSSDLSVWNKTYAKSAEAVSQLQSKYFESWKSELTQLTNGISFLRGVDIRFNRGWKQGESLYEMLKERESKERERGYTTLGPQRADLVFKIDGVETRKVLSRGQQKVLIVLAMLSQARIIEKQCEKKPIFLLDDLNAELDDFSLDKICQLIEKQGNQVFITSINPSQLISAGWSGEPTMFHVEHGQFVLEETFHRVE